MNSLLCLLLAVNAILAVPLNTYDEFPDDVDFTNLGDLDQQIDADIAGNAERNANDNVYLLFTRRNPNNAQTLVNNNANSINNSNFNRGHPTVVIVHGWRQNRNAQINSRIRDALLNRRETNVIVLDWNRAASDLNYARPAGIVPDIGRGLGQFLQFLSRTANQGFNNMHIVGFSLGAHVAGNAGRHLGGQLARITGLDPAGPLFYSSSNRLRASDAVYVEGIHTNGRGIIPDAAGIGAQVGNADFFPNGGRSQPGCGRSGQRGWAGAVSCHHDRAWELYAASIRYNFNGNRCNNLNEATGTNSRCTGAVLRMGNDDLNKRGTGIYRLTTRAAYPFF